MNEDCIASIGGKDHFLDFRDALRVAPIEEYASLFSSGGKDESGANRFKSGIRLTMTDNKAPKGEKFFDYLVDPYVVDQLLQVCRANLGQQVNEGINAILFRIACVGKGILTGLQTIRNDPANGSLGSFASASLKASKVKQEELFGTIGNPFTDYSYSLKKVNPYAFYKDPKTGKEDRSLNKCSSLEITRTTYRLNPKTNAVERTGYPWMVKIMNCYAPPHKTDKGLNYFKSKEAKDGTLREASMYISDEDMYAACLTVMQFITVWQNAYCIPAVIAGRKRREEEWQKNKEDRSYEG